MKNQKSIRNLFVIVLFLIMGLVFPTIPVKADMGIAPPSMHFAVIYQIPRTAIIEGHLLTCEDAECEKYSVVETVDYYSYHLTNFYCGGKDNSEWCHLGYGDYLFDGYHRISLLFDDGVTRLSNVFQDRYYASYYTLVVNETDLKVEEDVTKNWWHFTFSPVRAICFIPAAILTLLIEVRVAKLYSKKLKKAIKHITTANLISLPLVWFVIPSWLKLEFVWVLLTVELFAILFEATYLFLTNRKSKLTFKEGIVTSLIINLSSVGAGILLVIMMSLVVYVVVRI